MRKVISIVLALALILSMSAVAFAISSPTVYTIEYNNNGGTGTMEPQQFKASTITQALKSNGFTAPTGKVFSHWNTKADGTGTSYVAGYMFTAPGGNITLPLYAIWTTPTYSGGGSGDSTPAKTTETTATSGDVTVNMSTKDANSDEYTTPELTAEPTKEDAPVAKTVTFTVPSTASGGDTVVEFAVKNNSNGVVPMEKLANGTYKLIKKSAIGTNGPIAKIKAGKHTYVLVNNSKTVTDITEAWMGKGVQFVLSRELMQGVGGNQFDPYGTVDAATMATVFGRLDDQVTLDQSTGKNWEAAGQAWATQHGYPSTGELPRIDMFGVAYKYSGSPAVTQAQIDAFKAAFNDVADLTDEQLKYGAWALANGYTNGVGGGSFGGSLASDRGQFSTFLERYVQSLVK